MPIRHLLTYITVFVVVLVSGFLILAPTQADELDEINKKLSELQQALSSSQKATAPVESQLRSMQTQIAGIKQQVGAIEVGIEKKRIEIDEGYKALAKQREILNQALQNYYIKSYYESPIATILAAGSAAEVTQLLAYQKAATDQDKAIIVNLALTLDDLETKKQRLESEQTRLVAIKATLDKESAALDKVVQGAKAYQATLSKQIAELSAKQQQLLAQKLASLNIPQSAYTTQGGCVDDRNIDPGFSPRFAFFTFGVPNRVGLNQYGAKGRAEAGKGAESILATYYNAELNKGYRSDITITVNGTNEYGQSFTNQQWNIEEYVKHIYEIPSSWHPEALKAQAIAARSYALSRTNDGASSICPSQSCQVVKQEENAQAWKDAVDATKGWVLTSGGKPISAWFSSTHGGYVFTSADIGWSATAYTKNAKDTTTDSIASFSDLMNNAYDKASPWFYCDWGSRAQYNKTAWLKSDEVADIVNVLRLAKADSSAQKHLSQTDKPNPDGVETWDAGKVKQELNSKGVSAFNNISDVSVDWDKGGGRTTTITFSGDAGSVSFSGSEFKTFFNLRAPANINIVGPLYNIEKR